MYFMKKVTLTILLAFNLFLIGCSNQKENLKLEKTQKIEVLSVENQDSVIRVIDNKDDINDFVHKLQLQEWSNEEIPSNATKDKIYEMYQENTVKLGENNENVKNELMQVATITTYKDSPYISFKTKELSLSFKVPKDVAEYLSHNDK